VNAGESFLLDLFTEPRQNSIRRGFFFDAKGKIAMSIATKRRFEFVSGRSNKFWEVTVSGNEVLVHFGRNGTNGQSSRKSFADKTAAEKYADKLIQAKVAKGYVEVK
jgi:predicted DNA-binding WGR domain protein